MLGARFSGLSFALRACASPCDRCHSSHELPSAIFCRRMAEVTQGTYENLRVWRRSMDLVLEVHRTTALFPRQEVYGLTSQMRRAAVSVPSNIAEGKGRYSRKELLQFLFRARGSLLELPNSNHDCARAWVPGRKGRQVSGRTGGRGRPPPKRPGESIPAGHHLRDSSSKSTTEDPKT